MQTKYPKVKKCLKCGNKQLFKQISILENSTIHFQDFIKKKNENTEYYCNKCGWQK